ncbi:NAD(P)/FAD-dependent oxidoreductase [Arthrobacter sp. Marseille-P9274]|uniref:NAD(P)/FAD-dependent oxidoreductase n=1 Tax=Arthrobacter sp. Marseille-P9274 TaxID=2866572 RepID=UPI0021C79EE4|nr:FAD-dependent oxidoreductase [Arthrobacter sp. Marseille-P9274]
MAVQRVVIIGAGYAGVLAANRLAANNELAGRAGVTVVNPRPDFVERIRLHEVAAGTRKTASLPLESLLHPDVAIVVGRAARIDPDARLVHFTDGREPLGYDSLLYAAGSSSHAAAGAGGLADEESAALLRARLAGLAPGAVVNVVGGGLTGIEAASEIAERHPRLRVRLVSRGTIGSDLSASGRRELRRRLAGLGVALVDNTEAQRPDGTHLPPSSAETAPESLAPEDLIVWTAGFATPELARDSGLPTEEHGRLLVDEALSVPGHPEIFGAGDAARLPDSVGAHLRMACATAMPLGAHAADAIADRMLGRAPESFSGGFIVRCISLGRSAGLIQLVHADDRPRGLALRGRMGAMVKEQVCRMTMSWIRKEARGGSYGWPKGPRPAAALEPAGAR